MIDLHVHSTRSDGTYTPCELVDYAIEKGLDAFALTDHDTVAGLDEAMEYAAAASTEAGVKCIPEVIPGIEFSTEYQGRDIHIVGLYIDYKNEAFAQYLQSFIDSRTLRNQKMCSLLAEAGIDISYERLLEEFPNSVITRAHYAKYMLTHGYIKSIKEAFERYIGDNCPYFVPREKVTPAQAVELILRAGGVPILAHPVLYHLSNARLEELVAELKNVGLMGLEAIYSTYCAAEERQMRMLAKKYGLLISGGSDFHGSNKPGLDMGTGYGKLYIPNQVLDDIKAALS
ncbi:MAG: PHP domain-containing protein [Acetatifactor sp.]